jgi:hypothetical protein
MIQEHIQNWGVWGAGVGSFRLNNTIPPSRPGVSTVRASLIRWPSIPPSRQRQDRAALLGASTHDLQGTPHTATCSCPAAAQR